MSTPQFQSFDDFWPFYLREHQQKATRMLHFLGTTAGLLALTAAFASTQRRRRWLALAPVLAYGPAWFSHFFIEKNTPATFRHPLWSLRADLLMFAKMLNGTLDDELERATQKGTVPKSNGASRTVNTAAPYQHASRDPKEMN